MSNEDALIAAVVASPEDPLPMLILADFYDEANEGDLAYACRWCAAFGKRPVNYKTHYREPWIWGLFLESYQIPECCVLPGEIHQLIMGEGRYGMSWNESFKKAMVVLSRVLGRLKRIVEIPS